REAAVESVSNLGDVGDVTITSAADNEVLIYDTDGWINATLQEASIAKYLGMSATGISDPPTVAEVEALWGTAAANGVSWAIGVGPAAPHFIFTDGTTWWQFGGSVVDDGEQ